MASIRRRGATLASPEENFCAALGGEKNTKRTNFKKRTDKQRNSQSFLGGRPFSVFLLTCAGGLLYLFRGSAGSSSTKSDLNVDDLLVELNAESTNTDAFQMEPPPREVLPNASSKTFTGKMSYMNDYYKLRKEIDNTLPETDKSHQRRLNLVQKLRKNNYQPIGEFDNGIRDCPLLPPVGYPKQWLMTDLVHNWNPDDVTPHTEIFQGICIFDFNTEYEKAMNYRNANVPFVIRNDPEVLQTVERWNHPGYMHRMMGSHPRSAYYSKTNHFLYFNSKYEAPEGWEKPTQYMKMSYADWHTKAKRPIEKLGPNDEHWYYDIRACGPEEADTCSLVDKSEFMWDELSFFKRKDSFYKKDPTVKESIDCRFGMSGIIAESHFDAGENMIAVLGGERRYILSSPDQCGNLALYPNGHPSRRHTAVDFSAPDLKKYPQFQNAYGNEIVLQSGDVLYMPSHWFHSIVNLGLNWQCNNRSGKSKLYGKYIRACGFKV